MELFYQKWCEEMMKRIHNHLTRSFITEPNSKIPYNYSFQSIETKLESHQYMTPFDWSIDITNLIYYFLDGYEPDSPPYLIADDTLHWLNKKLDSIPKSQDDFNNKRIRKAIKIINVCLSGMSEKDKFRESHDLTPVTSDQMDTLQRMIEEIKDPRLLDKVLTILQMNVSALEISKEIVIDRKKITKKCFNEIRNAINNFDREKI